jgi:predicted nucleic-acid-binding protein
VPAALQAFDTNVIVRLLVRDEGLQAARAEQAFRRAIAAGGAWLSSVVLVEVSWVLRVAYKFDRTTTSAALRQLHETVGVHLEDEATTLLALAAFESGAADFADYFILESARRTATLPLLTFDEKLSRSTGVELVP